LSSAQIEDGTVDTADLATNAVTTAKITAGNVTTAKIADANVTTAKLAASSALVGKNIIINGEVAVSQRGTVTGFGANNAYGPDRWKYENGGSPTGRCSLSQGTGILGAASSLRVDVTTADSSLASNAVYQITQKIEAQDLHFLEYGAATAKTMTYSFTAKTNFTGSMTLYLIAADGSRSYATEIDFTGDSSQETFAFVIPGDASGAFNFDTGTGLDVMFTLSAGSGFAGGTEDAWAASNNNMYGASNSGNFFASTSNFIEFSLMQLEVGSVATDFEHEPISVTLAKCQRYFFRLNDLDAGMPFMAGQAITATRTRAVIHLPVTMRNTALGGITLALSAASHFSARAVNVAKAASGITAQSSAGGNVISLDLTIASTTAGDAILHESDTSNAYVDFSSEL